MSLSILIVNWNSKDYLRRCLGTIRSTCNHLCLQIVVVDGGSFDGCGDMLNAEFPEVEFLQSPENVGFGRSNNLGFNLITGQTLLLLNPDTELKGQAVSALLEQLERLPQAGILGPRLLKTDGSLQTSCVRALPTPLNRALDSDLIRRLLPRSTLWGTADAYTSAVPVEVEAVSGACMLMRSHIFRRVGGFTPEFFMYGEDMDLCNKVRRTGLKIYHVPNAEVTHHGGGSSRTQFNRFETLMILEAGNTYMRLNHGPSTAARFRLLQAVSAVLRLLVLLPVTVVGNRNARSCRRELLLKWMAVLKWSLGLESLFQGHDENKRGDKHNPSPFCPERPGPRF